MLELKNIYHYYLNKQNEKLLIFNNFNINRTYVFAYLI